MTVLIWFERFTGSRADRIYPPWYICANNCVAIPGNLGTEPVYRNDRGQIFLFSARSAHGRIILLRPHLEKDGSE